MSEKKAVCYGKVELIQGVICDGYVLDDDTAVMSERGTADLLGVDQKHLNRVRTNYPPKVLRPFIDKDLIVRTNSVEVVAENSPHKGRNGCVPPFAHSYLGIKKICDIGRQFP